ncbi:MAG TPA: BatA domain-containing protein [Anaeromyxobacteraceae bacterium]|nr:BatA domain-containing protein [Anaeromyxobacteraceae bacterium]
MRLDFAHPALLWGLLLALLPLLIHLFFRRRPKPLPFPALDFVLRARRETERRLKLRRLLLFLARTALVAAAALALTRPQALAPEAAAAAPAGPSAVALVLDGSASMRYQLGGRPLFERARADLLEVLSGLRNDEPATALVCGGPAPPAAPPPGFDRAALRRLLREAEPGFGHSDLTACLAAAARALSEPAAGAVAGRRIAVATDLAASAWRLDAPAPMVRTPAGPARPSVTLLDAARGAALPNLAVTALAAEPDPAVGPRGWRFTATLAHFGNGEARQDVPLALRVGLGAEARVPLRAFADVPASGAARKVLSHAFAAGGPTAVGVALPADGLTLDDEAWLTLDVPREVRALVVDGSPSPVRQRDEAFFVEAALASASSSVRPTVVDVEGLPRVRFSDFDVVFLLNVRSLGARAQELQAYVEKGGGLFLALGEEVDPERYDAELAKLLPAPLHLVKTAAQRGAPGADARAARFAEIDWDHPALAVFTGAAREGLLSVRTWRYMLLRPGERAAGAARERVLVRYDDGAPALVEARRGEGRVMLYTSTLDREWSDWTIRTSFLPAIQRIAAWLAGGLEERRAVPSVVEASRVVAPLEGQRLLALVDPQGRERPPPEPRPGAAPGPVTVTPDRPGLWQVKVEDARGAHLEPRLAFAVLADPRESDTTRLDPKEVTAWLGGEAVARVQGQGPSGGEGRSIPLWSVLLALAVAAFLAEGLLL